MEDKGQGDVFACFKIKGCLGSFINPSLSHNLLILITTCNFPLCDIYVYAECGNRNRLYSDLFHVVEMKTRCKEAALMKHAKKRQRDS